MICATQRYGRCDTVSETAVMSQFWYFRYQQYRYLTTIQRNCLQYCVMVAEISLLIIICGITLVNLIFILVISLKKKESTTYISLRTGWRTYAFKWPWFSNLHLEHSQLFSHIWCLKNANQKSWKNLSIKCLCLNIVFYIFLG